MGANGTTGAAGAPVWEAVFESAFDVFLLTGEDGRILRANRAAEAVLGVDPAELTGTHVSTLLPEPFLWPPHADGMRDSERRVVALAPDGRKVPVGVRCVFLDAPDGGGWVLVLRERARLEEVERHLADVIEGVIDGFALFDAEDRLVRCNRRFVDTFYSFGDKAPLGLSFEEMLCLCLDGGEFAGGMPVREPEAWLAERLAEHRSPPPDGVEFGLTDGRVLRLVERRRADGGTVSVFSDVSVLTQTEARLKEAIEAVSEGFVLWDARDRMVLCNTRFLETYPEVRRRIAPGMAYREFLDLTVAAGVVEIPGDTDPDDWVAMRMEHHAAPQGTNEQRLANGTWLLVSERRTRDGGIVTIETDVTTFKEQERKLRENEAFYRNYADDLLLARERLEEQSALLAELAEEHYLAKERAEAASLAKSQFLAIMSHELRTPLNAILGFSEMMRMQAFGPLGSEKYGEYVDDIHDSGSHLLDLITDILDMSKIEAGSYELDVRDCDLIEIAPDCVKMVEHRAAEAGVDLASEVKSGLPALRADCRAVKQCIINLLTNSVKFTLPGGRVTLSIRESDGMCVIAVADTGIGIPEKDLPRVADPFVQVEREKERSHEGTGLGLALTKKLVEMHGGTFTIESRLGEGTTVTLSLPMR